MSPEQNEAAGAYFGEYGFQYQRVAALAAVSGNMPIATSFEIAAGVSALVEQTLIPSTGKVLVDSLVDQSAQAFFRSSGIPMFIVNEVVERKIKPQLQSLRNLVDKIAGNKK